MCREGVKRLAKTLCCAAAFAANVYNYKAQQRVAGAPAVSKADFTTGRQFFNKVFYDVFPLNIYRTSQAVLCINDKKSL